MATIKTVDIQMLNADRQDATTIKLDNPRDGITREQVSAAMQPAFTNGWFLTNKGDVAMYLGDVTLSTSTKIILDGADFYVTPNEVTNNTSGFTSTTVTVSGATIQGYNVTDINQDVGNVMATIAANGLSITVEYTVPNPGFEKTLLFNLKLVIQGTIVTVPFYMQAS